jgi:hypothetical protein
MCLDINIREDHRPGPFKGQVWEATMPFLPISPGRHTARIIETLMHGAVLVLVLLVALVAFATMAPTLLAWPWLPWDRVRGLLELFREWTLRAITANRPDTFPDANPADDG